MEESYLWMWCSTPRNHVSYHDLTYSKMSQHVLSLYGLPELKLLKLLVSVSRYGVRVLQQSIVSCDSTALIYCQVLYKRLEISGLLTNLT